MGKNAYNLIEVGEIVYAAKDGKPMTIKAKYTVGFVTSEGFFAWGDVRKKFFYTKAGMKKFRECEG